ncbi:hypothetical protein V5O48_010907 [Marasmius crinis-equi]|uniref:Uncharacterized protein n=1 Tax=Marasmius crinis-equi TaxID=585013 RepID=A0ABR3F737_9AGAR
MTNYTATAREEQKAIIRAVSCGDLVPTPMSSPLPFAVVVAFATLSRAQSFDDDFDDHRRTRNIVAGVIVTMVIVMLFLSCWMYSVRRRRLAQMMSARQNTYQGGHGYAHNPYDVSYNYGGGQSQGWSGPPPAGPPPPGYTPTPLPGHQTPYKSPSDTPPGYGGKGADEGYGYHYPPPPGSPPAQSQSFYPPPGPPPRAHVHP